VSRNDESEQPFFQLFSNAPTLQLYFKMISLNMPTSVCTFKV